MPELGEPEVAPQRLAPIEHAFTHFDLRLNPIRVRLGVPGERGVDVFVQGEVGEDL